MREQHKHEHCDSPVADAIHELIKVLKKIFGHKPNVHFDLVIGMAVNKDQTGENMVAIVISNEQKVNVTLNPVTDTKKPAKLDGAPVWSVISGDSTFIAAPDGLSADLVSSDTPGETVFLVDADADLGTGVEDLQETITLTVTGANAKNLGITVGSPTTK